MQKYNVSNLVIMSASSLNFHCLKNIFFPSFVDSLPFSDVVLCPTVALSTSLWLFPIRPVAMGLYVAALLLSSVVL